MNQSIKEMISENVNICSNPSELKITDIRVANINGAPKHCPLIKVYTNQGLVGYGEVRDASSATYALMLKSNDLAIGIDNPLFKDGFVNVPNKPGLGIDELNEELIAEHMHEKYPGIWEPTTEWDKEWANDREWS